jgi:heme A synthase
VVDLHRFVAYSVPTLFALLTLGAIWTYLRNREPGAWYWNLLAAVQVVLGVQVLVGVILFASGGRPQSNGPNWLHYVYGAVFPIGVLYFAHKYARKHPGVEMIIFGVACFVAFGLTFRALQTGLGID